MTTTLLFRATFTKGWDDGLTPTEILTIMTDTNYVNSKFLTTSVLHISYGDGTNEVLPVGSEFVIKHSYKKGTYTVEIHGDIPEVPAYRAIYKMDIMYGLGNNMGLGMGHAGGTIYDLFINPDLFKSNNAASNTDGDAWVLNTPAECTICHFYPRDGINNAYIRGNRFGSNGTDGNYSGVLPRWLEPQLPRLKQGEFDGTVFLSLNSNSAERPQAWYSIRPYYMGTYAVGDTSGDYAYRSNNVLQFDSTFATNMIGPKLGGRVFGEAVTSTDNNTYTYTTWPNKKLKEIIATALGFGGLGFDEATHTLSFRKTSGSGTKVVQTKQCMALKFVFEDGTFDVDHFYQRMEYKYCLVEGTQILMHDGTTKDIQNIQYDDLVQVYDFFRGKVCYQFPSFIDQETTPSEHAKITLEDGSIIRTTGSHCFYNHKTKQHQLITIESIIDNTFDKNSWELLKLKDGVLTPIKIKNVELIRGTVKSYSFYTAGTQTYFANGVISSCRDFNLFGATIDNKLDLARFNFVKEHEHYTLEDFKKMFGPISSTVYYGQLQHILYNGYKLGLDAHYEDLIKQDYGSYESSTRYGVMGLWARPKPLPTELGKELNYIAFLDETGNVLSKETHVCGTVIKLPASEKGWYCVADNRTYFDTYEIKTNTVLEKVV